MLQRVFVDADVLAARAPFEWLALLRDETGDWFQLHSTSEVVAESVREWVARDPERREGAAERRCELLATSLDEVLDSSADAAPGHAPGPLGAAASSGSHVLLSSRAGDVAGADELPFEVYTADEFLCLLDDTAATHVRSAAARQYAARQDAGDGDGASNAGLAEALTAAGCPAFAERVSRHLRSR
ncbi:hypothetical protein [Microbacterium hibisci]|uniref:hypothetical protein n=1 Tax=Microbacterium hibisci TaxID=2036000 RepID=UPI00194255F1|nr:hypothetical protein [Microbacterium hibisci]